MGYRENPFTPSFGEVPLHMAGRQQILRNMNRAFESTHRRPELTTIVSGARGSGKTALISSIATLAEEQGWVSVSVTALPGMMEDIEIQATRKGQHLLDRNPGPQIASIGIPQIIDVEFATATQIPTNWRSRMEDLVDALNAHGTGLLITVDEIDVNLGEMIQLAAVYQHFVQEGKKVALVMAGLPSSVSALISNKTVSFLRRARLMMLGPVNDEEVAAALAQTFADGGRCANEGDLREASVAIGGFPYLLQLVGYYAWDHANADLVTKADLTFAVDAAAIEMRSSILDATLRELSPEDIRFACAMLEDEGDSRIADISQRLSRSSSQVSQYRRRLIEAGVIGERRRGVVGFDLPFFREYLLEKRDDGDLL